MPKSAFFLRTRDLLVSQKTTQRHFFSTLHPLSTVTFATATVLVFVLLRNSRFKFHCYTQLETTPTPKSARKCAATSRDFLRERLQSAFTLANQLRWIAQYLHLATTLASLYLHLQPWRLCIYAYTTGVSILTPSYNTSVSILTPSYNSRISILTPTTPASLYLHLATTLASLDLRLQYRRLYT